MQASKKKPLTDTDQFLIIAIIMALALIVAFVTLELKKPHPEYSNKTPHSIMSHPPEHDATPVLSSSSSSTSHLKNLQK